MKFNHQLQSAFQAYLISAELDVEPYIQSTPSASARTRLNIYRHAYQARLLSALATHFPCLQQLMGEGSFHQLGLHYIQNFPPSHHSIRRYGEHLSSFLLTYFENEYPYLAELAEFEWKMTLAFDAQNAAIIDIETLVAVPPESWSEIKFTPHPSLQRLNTYWNVVDLWKASKEQRAFPEVNQQAFVSWVIWRYTDLNRFDKLSEDEAWAMDGMINQSNFGQLCEGLCRWHNEEAVGMKMASFLKRWIDAGQISSILY